MLPPLLIAYHRVSPKKQPRYHVIFDMDFQPKYKAQVTSPLFADGRAARAPVAGTVARGQLHDDERFYLGKEGDDWVTELPVPVTMELMERGQQRFNIYCSSCHGLSGDGKGIVPQRSIKRQELWQPISLTQKGAEGAPGVPEQPVGQIFNTITHGIRTMPSYAAQIPVEDRWAIVLYVRALQRSQNARVDDVPEDIRPQLR